MSNLSEELIVDQYKRGLVDVSILAEFLIKKFKQDRNSIDIQQCQFIIEYLLLKES